VAAVAKNEKKCWDAAYQGLRKKNQKQQYNDKDAHKK
jgi:hypothetical protein